MAPGHRTATVEEGIGLPSAGPRGERLLPVQVDHRECPSGPYARRASGRGPPRVQCPESDGRAWQARVVQYRSVKGLCLGSL